jgi:hypothetical protein
MPRKKTNRPRTSARANARASARSMQSVVVNVGTKPAPRRRQRAQPLKRLQSAPVVMQLPLMINTQAHTTGQPFQPVSAMLAPPLSAPSPSQIAQNEQFRKARVDALKPTSVTAQPPVPPVPSQIAPDEQFWRVAEFVDPETGFAKWGQAEPVSPPQRAVPSSLEDEFERLDLTARAEPFAGATSSAAAAAAGVPGERARGLTSTERDRRDRPLAMARFPHLTIKEALKMYRAELRGEKAATAAPGP